MLGLFWECHLSQVLLASLSCRAASCVGFRALDAIVGAGPVELLHVWGSLFPSVRPGGINTIGSAALDAIVGAGPGTSHSIPVLCQGLSSVKLLNFNMHILGLLKARPLPHRENNWPAGSVAAPNWCISGALHQTRGICSVPGRSANARETVHGTDAMLSCKTVLYTL
eukprot:1615572-Rhodomonas_salina.1